MIKKTRCFASVRRGKASTCRAERKKIKKLVPRDEYFLKVLKYFLYMRWRFLKIYEDLLMWNIKSLSFWLLLWNYQPIMKIPSLTFFRDPSATNWPWMPTGSRLACYPENGPEASYDEYTHKKTQPIAKKQRRKWTNGWGEKLHINLEVVSETNVQSKNLKTVCACTESTGKI